MSTDSLTLGTEIGPLTVDVVKGDDRATLVLVLYELQADDTELAIPWDYAPTLKFETGLEVSSTLGVDPESTVVDSMATWEITGAQLDTFWSGMDVSLKVNGETWYSGSVRCQS